MRKFLFLMFLLATVLPMTSCRRAAEKARRNIAVEAVEQVEWHGFSGADVMLRVRNDTRYKLQLERADLEFYLGDRSVTKVLLRDGVEIPRRTTMSVATQWRIRVSDPLALVSLMRKVQKGDVSQVLVSCSIEGRGGPARVKFDRVKIPLSVFLSTFGVDIEALNKLLKK